MRHEVPGSHRLALEVGGLLSIEADHDDAASQRIAPSEEAGHLDHHTHRSGVVASTRVDAAIDRTGVEVCTDHNVTISGPRDAADHVGAAYRWYRLEVAIVACWFQPNLKESLLDDPSSFVPAGCAGKPWEAPIRTKVRDCGSDAPGDRRLGELDGRAGRGVGSRHDTESSISILFVSIPILKVAAYTPRV